jgi:hypothetical protein
MEYIFCLALAFGFSMGLWQSYLNFYKLITTKI